MKLLRSILAVPALLALAIASTNAVTIPASEDTHSSSTHQLTPGAGISPTLKLSQTSTGYVRFDLDMLPAAVTAENLVSARLRLYVVKADKGATNLGVAVVSNDWHETNKTAAPSNGVFTIIASKPVSRQFYAVDVTAVIKSVLTNGPDFGFAIGITGGKLTVSTKEGPAIGYPAELEVEANLGLASGGFLTAPGLTTIGLPVTVGGGHDLTIQAGGSVDDGGAAAGGNLDLRAGAANLSGSGAGGPSFNNNLRLFAGDNLFLGIEGDSHNGNIEFFAGNGLPLQMTLVGNTGFFGIGTAAPTSRLQVNGEAKATVFTPTSDRNAKENFTPISPREVLDKVTALPISQWSFKDLPGTAHIGPRERHELGFGSVQLG